MGQIHATQHIEQSQHPQPLISQHYLFKHQSIFPMAISDLVLLTGGTGYIGSRTLRYALEQGYHVRAAVRSQAKADAVRNSPALKGLTDNLDFVIVPDFLASGAFNEAIKGVKYAVHLASPLAKGSIDEDLDAKIIQPAVQGAVEMLEAAKKESTVKKVVITSSAVALPPVAVLGGQQRTDQVFTTTDRAHDIPGPYPATFVAYIQSKIASLKAVDAWVQKHGSEISFDVITILPGFVGGRSDNATNVAELLDGTNFWFLAPILGKEAAKNAGSQVANTVHVDDVAKAHIESLSDKVTGNQSFILSNQGGEMQWNDSKAIVSKHFPEAVKSGLLPNDGVIEEHFFMSCDNQSTVKAFGELKSFEEIISGLVEQYLELQAQEKK
ncbi:hypothetical protein LTR15_005909 [Elasticomyces elasticus]|nr:hypothetical protein LTR15_005909 [Elasticomyces elasticus]